MNWSMGYHACQTEIVPLWLLLSELHIGPCLLWNKTCSADPQLILKAYCDVSEHPDC